MLPSAYGLGQYFQDLGHSLSPYGPPSRQITYIYTPHGVFHYSLWPSNSNPKKLKPQFSSLSLLGNKNR